MAAIPPPAGAPGYPQHANVYIRNISPLADENTIRSMFEPYGAIVTMKLVRNKAPNGRSYAFVNYQAIESAHNAIISLNGFQFDDGVIEVKSANTDAQFDKLPAAQPDTVLPNDNLYITNLPHFYTEEDLVSLFQSFGSVISTKILNRADNPMSSVNALVRMASVDEASAALQRLNNQKVPGGTAPVSIKFADTPEQKAMRKSRAASKLAGSRYQPYDSASRPPSMSYPPPASSINPPGHNGVAPNGYAMPLQEISFNQPPPMSLPTYQPVDPNYPPAPYDPNLAAAGPPGMAPFPPASASIYIKSLPDKADKLYLYETFAPLGAIRSVNVMADAATGLCNGVGFVNFVDGADAVKAVQHFNGSTVEGKVLYVAIQPPKPYKSKQFGGPGGPGPAPTHMPAPAHVVAPAPMPMGAPAPEYAPPNPYQQVYTYQ